jgi:hypothetical protein
MGIMQWSIFGKTLYNRCVGQPGTLDEFFKIANTTKKPVQAKFIEQKLMVYNGLAFLGNEIHGAIFYKQQGTDIEFLDFTKAKEYTPQVKENLERRLRTRERMYSALSIFYNEPIPESRSRII